MKESFPAQDIKKQVNEIENDAITFFQDLIRIPSPSTKEKAMAERILLEMEKVGFDDAWIDEAGNVIGRIGPADAAQNVLFDGHIDTVGITDPDKWKRSPLGGEIADGFVWGRGAADNKQAPAVQVYGAALAKRIWGHSLPIGVYVIGSVMEEDCDGLALELAIKESIKAPISAVIIGEANRAVALGERLQELGFLVACIRPPTVPQNSTRLRISVTSAHTEEQVTQLVETLEELMQTI